MEKKLPEALSLRSRAEGLALKQERRAPLNDKLISSEAFRHALHDLQVHQIELEMQNEALRTTEIELAQEHQRFFDLYDLAPVGYCTVTQAGLIVQANLTLASQLGIPRVKLLKHRLSQYVGRASQDTLYMLRQKLMETGEPQQCDLQILRADGSAFWALMAATVEKLPNGSLQVRMVTTDISDRRQAEENLYLSEERYRNLFNAMDEGFCILEMVFDTSKRPIDYRYLEVNPSFERQSGIANATGRLISELLPHIEAPWIEAFGQVSITGKAWRTTGEVKDLGRWFDVCCIRVDRPERRRVALVFSDVSERKRAEADRYFLDQVLQQRNLELETARAAADKANRAKSEFLSSMSHELRTPLTAILGFAQLVEASSPALAPVQKRNVGQILSAGWYLLELINQILDLAVVESGGLTLSMGDVSLDNVLRECHALVQAQAKSHDIALHFLATKSLCKVRADHTRLKQAILNILSNAIKYNHLGGKVALQLDYTAPGQVRLSIADTGVGLTEDQVANLYQPFNRLGREGGAESGTGIGLVMTKRIVELMGGTIGVHSTVGLGSTFWIDLKLAPQNAQAYPEGGAPGTDYGESAASSDNTEKESIRANRLATLADEGDLDGLGEGETGQIDAANRVSDAVEFEVGVGVQLWIDGEADPQLEGTTDVNQQVIKQIAARYGQQKILYVEDNPTNRGLVQALLEPRSDLLLHCASDGLSGLALARTELPHVILMDLLLPGLSGIDLQRILSLDPQTAHIPVIALSANAMPAGIQAGLNAGFFLYLTKPVKNEELLHALDSALAHGRQKRMDLQGDGGVEHGPAPADAAREAANPHRQQLH